MKKILITGANSYIGSSFENYLNKNYNSCYQIDTLDMINESWKNFDFSSYDVIYHVAGIAHIKETKDNKDLYYKVNKDLAIEVAKKAKQENVKQFIFLSSMSVYGIEKGFITKDTTLNPKSNYAKSKLQAEEVLKSLQTKDFKICIIRPPMVYGKDCKGNFQSLIKFAKKLPIFPKVKNNRSMIYIDNLSEFVKLLIDNSEEGLFCPQNNEYSNTSYLVKLIGQSMNKKVRLFIGLGWLIKLSSLVIKKLTKAFGSLYYDMKLSEYKQNYALSSLEESIKESV